MKNASIYLARGWYGKKVKITMKRGGRKIEETVRLSGMYLGDEGRSVKVKAAGRKVIIGELAEIDFTEVLRSYWSRRKKILASGALTLTLQSPLAIGLGESLPLDMPGIALHRNYGFPYIPGSGVRGVVRHVVSVAKLSIKDDRKRRQFALVERLLFGNEFDVKRLDLNPSRTRGVVHFLNAVPLAEQADGHLIEGDIINNHHLSYYTTDKGVPVDTENPRPVYFLRVKAGTKFHFAWVVEDEEEIRKRWKSLFGKGEEVQDLDVAVVEFFDTLDECYEMGSVEDEGAFKDITKGVGILIRVAGSIFGFGAKTRVGYGRVK